MKISIDKTSEIALYIQIYEQIRSLIISGQLLAGYRIPSERKLAELLGVDRRTTLNAYRELRQQGLVHSYQDRRGTIVAGAYTAPLTDSVKSTIKWHLMVSDRVNRLKPRHDDELLLSINRRNVISLVGRWNTFPGFWTDDFILPELIAESARCLPGDEAIVSPPGGLPSFRQAICQMMFDGGGYCNHEQIMVTNGGAHGLELVAQALINPGDIVICEEPTYNGARRAFIKAGGRLIGAHMTPGGMDLEMLESLLTKYHPKFIYTMPTGHNPCGITAGLPHRKKLLRLAYRYKVPVVEDDPYWGMPYNGREDLPTLRSLDSDDHVIYIGTFSKVLTPRLGIGWLCLPRKLVRPFKKVISLTVINSNTRAQIAVQRMIKNGKLYEYTKKLLNMDLENDAIFREVMNHRPVPGVLWEHESEGPFRAISLPPNVKATDFTKEASANGVAVIPGTFFSINHSIGEMFVRISVRFVSHEDIFKGTNILVDTAERMANRANAMLTT